MKERLEDLDHADDICLIAQRFCGMEEKLKRLKEEAELVGLHININKTKGMRVNTSKLRGFSPRANHTDRAAAAGRRS